MKRKKAEVEFMEKYRIGADSLQIILMEKYHNKKPINIAYFSNPKSALDYIIDKEIRESWVEDLKEVVKGMDRLHNAIQQLNTGNLPQVLQSI